MITLRQLRYLGALAEHRHFGRAAEACAVTQPALSMQIKDLEQQLGVDLVERRARRSRADRHRRTRWRGARSACWLPTRDLVDFARHRGRLLTGGCSSASSPRSRPMCCRKSCPVLQRRYPELRVELRETQTRVLLEELGRGALDVVMLALPADDTDIETIRLFDDPFLLAVPATDDRHETRAGAARRTSISSG